MMLSIGNDRLNFKRGHFSQTGQVPPALVHKRHTHSELWQCGPWPLHCVSGTTSWSSPVSRVSSSPRALRGSDLHYRAFLGPPVLPGFAPGALLRPGPGCLGKPIGLPVSRVTLAGPQKPGNVDHCFGGCCGNCKYAFKCSVPDDIVVEISDEDDPGEGGDQPEIEAGAGAGTTVENAIDL